MALSPNKEWHKIFFLSCLRDYDQELIVVIVYYFQIWIKKNTTLLLVGLLAVTWVPHILRHPIYIYIYANFIKLNRHFMSTYFLLDPFEFPYYFYRIREESIYVLSIVVCISSTFCPTLGHHQGRIYYKSDVTFVLANYYCVRASLPLKIMALAFKCNSLVSASS